jgi:hypothetical protein
MNVRNRIPAEWPAILGIVGVIAWSSGGMYLQGMQFASGLSEQQFNQYIVSHGPHWPVVLAFIGLLLVIVSVGVIFRRRLKA